MRWIVVVLLQLDDKFRAEGVTVGDFNHDGKLDIDAPVAELWPEFAQKGKEHVTTRMMLDHSAGVPALMRMQRSSGAKPGMRTKMPRPTSPMTGSQQ